MKGTPEILCNELYSGFASWPRRYFNRSCAWKLEFDVRGEDRSTVGVRGIWEDGPAGWLPLLPVPAQGFILWNERESAGSHVNGS